MLIINQYTYLHYAPMRMSSDKPGFQDQSQFFYGSVESLKVSYRRGFKPKARQLRLTAVSDTVSSKKSMT